ncbi:paramyosin-like [Platichthys flesus]|uniref:paramyosin-like n=1 Tax=Platichthys flesus TaxID=8260 RepID=UPI002DB84BBC|nr:paramyosin-like [Platichthys flesus]
MNEIEKEIEEEIEVEREEETADESNEEIEEELEEATADESEEEILEELEGETLQECDYPSDFEEFIESEQSTKIDLQKDLLKEGGARTALEVNTNSAKRDRSQLEDYLKKERKEKEALPITLALNQEQSQTSSHEATIEHMKAERADRRSGEDQQHHEDQQLASENKTPRCRLEDALHEKALARKQLQEDREACIYDNMTHENQQLASENKRLQGELEDALREMRLAGDAALSEQLVERDKLDSLTRENQQVASVNEKLRSELVDALRERHVADISKQRTLDDLTEENHHLASKSKRLQGELEDALRDLKLAGDAALSEQLVERNKLDFLTQENQQVASVNEKLRSELVNALSERHVADISKQRTLDDLTEENHHLASKSKRLQGELEDALRDLKLAGDAALSEQLVERNKLDFLTQENQQVASVNEKLRSELVNALSERHVADISKQRPLDDLTEENHHLASNSKRLQGELEDAVQQHQEDIEACSRLEEQVKKEKARFLQLNKKLARLKRGQADKELLMNEIETLSLQNNDITGKLEAMEAKIKETMSQKDDIIFKNQATIVENQQLASENKRLQVELEEQAKKEKVRFLQLNKKLARLKRGPADTEELTYDKETCRMENKYITGKLEAMEAKYDLLVQRDGADPWRKEELLAQKDDVILSNQAIKLQYVVDELRTQQSESKMKQAQLEDTLRQAQIQRAVLEERISNTASLEKQKMKNVHLAYALKTERAKSKRYSFELTEAKINQVKLQEGQQETCHVSSGRR